MSARQAGLPARVSTSIRYTVVVGLVAFALPLSAAPPRPASLFVATNGNDRWSGTLPAPNAQGTDGPLATLARARDVARSLRKEGPLPAGFAIKVRGGKYYLKESLVLMAQDSGTHESPIIYTAYCIGSA